MTDNAFRHVSQFSTPKVFEIVIILWAVGNDEAQMHVDIPCHPVTHSLMEKTQTGNIINLKQQLSMKL